MATIQPKISRGHKYWYIVESRRINGKPRPIVLEYLGKPEDLLRRLQGIGDTFKVKSYSHGGVAALLDLAGRLEVVPIINRYILSRRPYMPQKPLRNKLTGGITLLLAAIGRACMPTSKRGWWKWAKSTSCEYLLRISLSNLDSQHFWDLMDCLPEDAIEKIELELLHKLLSLYPLSSNTLLYDTTNFYTYINSTNTHCDIAQRGKNKQKRNDLRQVGLAMVVTKEDYIPLFHHTYKGNINDIVIFKQVISRIKKRMLALKMDVEKHTLVFDRGCNSKKNLRQIKRLKLHYVGALTPSDHEDIIRDAEGKYVQTDIGNGTSLWLYREKRIIWGEERTVVVLVSKKLKSGQLRGIYQALKKKIAELRKLQRSLKNSKAKKHIRVELEEKIENLLKGQFMEGLITYSLFEIEPGKFVLTYRSDKKKFNEMEDKLGFRILMTDRHEWESADIVKAYYGQASVEMAFKNIKNPYHLTVIPEFHWTDQKIRVHYFTCVLGYLLSVLILREARIKSGFKGTLNTLLDMLNNVRLSTILEKTDKQGKAKAIYKLEEMSAEENLLMEVLNLKEIHLKRPKIKGVGVYN